MKKQIFTPTFSAIGLNNVIGKYATSSDIPSINGDDVFSASHLPCYNFLQSIISIGKRQVCIQFSEVFIFPFMIKYSNHRSCTPLK